MASSVAKLGGHTSLAVCRHHTPEDAVSEPQRTFAAFKVCQKFSYRENLRGRVALGGLQGRKHAVPKSILRRAAVKPFSRKSKTAEARFCCSDHIKRCRQGVCQCTKYHHETTKDEDPTNSSIVSLEPLGVKVALTLLSFYKSEISPLLPGSCRYVPTCSEYSMAAFRKYGVLKGTVLTAWRIARCNPLGGSGFDPPRWFGEPPSPS